MNNELLLQEFKLENICIYYEQAETSKSEQCKNCLGYDRDCIHYTSRYNMN